MSATSLMTILASLCRLWGEQASAQQISCRLGTVEHAPAATSLLVVRPHDPGWARAQVAVNDDGSAAWVILDEVSGDPLTLGALREALGDPTEVLRIRWNEPERMEFRYRSNGVGCSVRATLADDGAATGDRAVTSVGIYPDRSALGRLPQ
jgi:hypothetical protein